MVANAFFTGRCAPDDVLDSSTVGEFSARVVSRKTQPALWMSAQPPDDNHPDVCRDVYGLA
jgi:hypothetical protein